MAASRGHMSTTPEPGRPNVAASRGHMANSPVPWKSPVTLSQWHARRRQAYLWAGVIAGLVAAFSAITWIVIPRHIGGMGMHWPAKGESGLTLSELASLMGLATMYSLAITAAQDIMWPFIDPARRGEKVFFGFSIFARAVFIGTLVYHHYGPGAQDVASTGDGAHRMQLMALFYAAYSTDLIQMWRRPQQFTKTFTNFMVPHHLLSFAWFTPWLVFMAPRGVEGAPIWNTTFLYLCAAMPNHTYKLVSCWYKPDWYGWLMGPSIYAHWAVLLTSQAYYFTQCSCSAWGCWYPATLMMLAGAWAMAVWDVPSFLDSIVFCNSKMLGAPIGVWDIGPLVMGKGRPAFHQRSKAPAKVWPPPLSPANSCDLSEDEEDEIDQIDGATSDSFKELPPVTVELILRPQLQTAKSVEAAAAAKLAALAGPLGEPEPEAPAFDDQGGYAKQISLQAGGTQATSFGLAPGERKGDKVAAMLRARSRVAPSGGAAARDGAEEEAVDLSIFSRTVTLQAGGTQAISFGLSQGERKGDRTRARLTHMRTVRA